MNCYQWLEQRQGKRNGPYQQWSSTIITCMIVYFSFNKFHYLSFITHLSLLIFHFSLISPNIKHQIKPTLLSINFSQRTSHQKQVLMTMLIVQINKITSKQIPNNSASPYSQMKSSYKTSPKTIIDQIKKRRQTINIIESQYNLAEKIRSPKTEKKQSFFIKDFKNQPKYQKHSKILYTEIKKSQRTNSLAPYETDLTPKKLMHYYIDSSQPKQRPLRKIHSISLVDTPKKLNLKKKTQEQLFTVKEQLNKQGCKKVASSYKISGKSYSKPLRIQSTNRVHESMDVQDLAGMKSSKKIYSKNNENYDIYYNEGNHQHNSGNMQNMSNSSSQLRSSKKVKITESHCQNSSIAMEKQKSSSRTLRITRNSRSSNHGKQQHFKKNLSNINTSSKNNTKSQKGMTSPRVEEFELDGESSSEKKFQKMFFKCSLILKKYNHQLEKLKGQNQSLLKKNQYLRSSLSQRAL